MRASVRCRLKCATIIILVCIIVLLSSGIFISQAQARTSAVGPGLGLSFGQLNQGENSRLVQPATWIARKLAFSVRHIAIPAIFSLPVTISAGIEEPLEAGADAKGHYYTDTYMWYLCGPGATAVALSYWKTVNTNIGNGYYTDPHATLFWESSSHARTYIMYIATKSAFPGDASSGETTYFRYNNGGSADADTTNAAVVNDLNWETSGKNAAAWNTFFYTLTRPGLSLAALVSYIVHDLYVAHAPPVVSLNDAYLPGWKNSAYKGGSHDVAIIGYNMAAATFTYVETCGPGATGCETSGTGPTTISETALLQAINNDNGNGALIW